MKDVMDPLCNSWFGLLDGQVSYSGTEVKVYPGDPDNADYSHHIIIRAESENDRSNKHSFSKSAVVIIEIVTIHSVKINKSIVNNISDQVTQLVFPTRKQALPVLNGLQITNVIPESATFLEEDDGVRKYHRKLIRFNHRVTQTTT